MRLDHLSTEAASAIRSSLEKYKLKQWGFVIFRCTYSSQEKWDKFVTLIKEHAYDYFEWRGMEDLYDSMAWTIIEDPETLDGASIVEMSRKFGEWVEREGRQEMQGSIFTDTWVYCPRYSFFMHVDEESLESVVDDEKAREESGYFCTIVREDMVLAGEREREAQGNREWEIQDAEDAEDEEDEELLDLRKRVKIDALVALYATLLDIDRWYNIWVDSGIAQI